MNGLPSPADIPVLRSWIRLRSPLQASLFWLFMLCSLVALLFGFCRPAHAQERELVVGSASNFPPYEFVDSNGAPSGYAVDLIKAVAKEEHLNIRVVSGPWADIRRQFDNGQIDILSAMMYLTRATPYIDFTLPHSTANYSLFVRKGSPRLHSDADLRGRTVLVQEGDLTFARLAQIGVKVVRFADQATALRELAGGQGDAVMAPRAVALYHIRQLGIRNLEISEDSFEPHILCFAVRRGRTDKLLDRLNEGLARVKQNGVQQELTDRWLSPWEPRRISLRQILAVFGILAGLLLIAFAWSWTLRKRVRQRTASLQSELAHRLRAEARILKLNRLYAVTNEINKAIVRVRDRDALYTEVCRVIVDHGNFPLAWIGLVDAAENRILPVAQAGIGSEYLPKIKFSTLKDSPEASSPVSTAVREGRIATGCDSGVETSSAPKQFAALARDLRSCAALPLTVDTRTVATLTLYAAEPDFFDDEEELALLSGVARDISFALEAIDHEHRREYAEQALHESEERFRTAFEQAAVGVALCSADTIILAANSALCEMLGYSREELVGREMLSPDLTHPDDVELSRQFAARLLSGELSRGTGEKRYLCKDGHIIWTQVVVAVVRDAAGKPLYFINQIQDITAARAAEEKLHEAYEDMESIFRASPAAIVTVDANLSVKAWNRSAERMFGWPIGEVLGHKLPMMRPCDWDLALKYLERTLQGEEISNQELKLLRRDGGEIDVSASSSPVRDAAGRYTGGVATFTDITERKRSEEKLREAYETMEGIFRSSPSAIVMVDDNVNVLVWNKSSERVFGWTADEVLGHRLPIILPEHWDRVAEYQQRTLNGELISNEELRVRRKDGVILDVSASSAPMRDAAGRYAGAVLTFTDISELKRSEERLREAYGTLEAIFRASPVAILATDHEQNINVWNKAAEHLFGWTEEEVLGHKFPAIPEEADEYRSAAQVLSRGEVIDSMEVRARTRDGAQLDLICSAAPIRDATGRVTSSVGLLLDITARKHAEEELRRAYEALNAIFRASPLAIMALQDHQYVTLWNQAAERMYGWKAEEAIGRIAPMVPPEETAAYEKLREALFRGEVVTGMEAKAVRKDGTSIDILFSASPMRDEQGRFTIGIGMSMDITDRKRGEQELRDANASKETILRVSPVALVVLDLEANVTVWNQASERLFGWTAEEVLGRPSPIIPDDDQSEQYREVKEHLLRGESVVDMELKRRRKDGTLVDVSGSVTPFLDAEGLLKGALIAYVDLTERKRLEAQLLQSQKLESVGRLAGGIAHDFNNLLTVINCHSDLLLERVSRGGPLSEGLQEVRKAGEQASRLTRQLLAFSRQQMLQPRVIDVNAAVRDISGMLERLLGEDIQLNLRLGSAPDRVRVDPGQFQQVIMNLAVNARDAMPNGGTLTISTTSIEHPPVRTEDGDSGDTPQVMLAVSDTGCGMSEETQRRIFEPFFTTKPAGEGTGLGLSMVWGIVKQSGGHVWLNSEPEKGTTFNIVLPRVEEPAADSLQANLTGTLRGTESLLLVEDQPQLRELTSRILRGYGYRVLEAANGLEALRIVEQDGVSLDLVVTDIVMPGMTGIELAKRLQTIRPGLRLLYMSGYTDDVILRQGKLETGAAYLEKPFTPDGLAAKIRQVLGISATDTESAA